MATSPFLLFLVAPAVVLAPWVAWLLFCVWIHHVEPRGAPQMITAAGGSYPLCRRARTHPPETLEGPIRASDRLSVLPRSSDDTTSHEIAS